MLSCLVPNDTSPMCHGCVLRIDKTEILPRNPATCCTACFTIFLLAMFYLCTCHRDHLLNINKKAHTSWKKFQQPASLKHFDVVSAVVICASGGAVSPAPGPCCCSVCFQWGCQPQASPHCLGLVTHKARHIRFTPQQASVTDLLA